MTRQKGSAEVIIIAGLAILLALALGYILWQNFIDEPEEANRNTADTSESAEEGAIVGSLTYPSEGIPPAMAVHAINIETHEVFSTDTHLTGASYTTGVGYRLSVPAGDYYVYGTKGLDTSAGATYAFYDEFMKCGIRADCKDETKIKVTVEPNKDTEEIVVGNWWTTRCNYQDSEATIAWLLSPTCPES